MAHDKWSTRLDLQSVPIGHVLDTRMEPTSEEIKGFEDWVCPLNPHPRWERASSLRVTTEDSDGSHVLEYWAKGDQSLLTGDLDWQDAQIEAQVRQLIATSSPGPDDEFSSVSRCGVMARLWTVRHYYLFCLEGLNRIVLYRRENNLYTLLAVEEMKVDPNRYYLLRLEVRGNRLRGYCDNELVADVFDPTYTHGRLGIRTNALSRFREVSVHLKPREVNLIRELRKRKRVCLEKIREAYPKPVLWRSIDLKIYGSIEVLGATAVERRTTSC